MGSSGGWTQGSQAPAALQPLGLSTNRRRQASAPMEVWNWDFVSDQTQNGSSFRILTLIDEYTRECHRVQAGWSIHASDVTSIVETAIQFHGTPKFIRSDNGPEFIAYAMQDWLAQQQIETSRSSPALPGSRNISKASTQVARRELFGSLRENQVVLEGWRCEYKDQRPHSSLGYLTPSEYAASREIALRATPYAPSRSANAEAPFYQLSNPSRTIVLRCPAFWIGSNLRDILVHFSRPMR